MGQPAVALPPYKSAVPYVGPKEAFVSFSWYHRGVGKYKREKVRLGVWKAGDDERDAMMTELARQLNNVIDSRNRAGVYHDDVVTSRKGGRIKTDVRPWTAWIEEASKSEGLPPSTRGSLGNLLHNVRLFLADHPPFAPMLPGEVAGDTYAALVAWMRFRGLSGKSINAYLWALQVAMEYVRDAGGMREVVKTEPWRLKHRKNESGMYRPLTIEEKEAVFGHFRTARPGYYLYLCCIYYTCIRPGELRRLKVGHFDLRAGKITLPDSTTKNKRVGHVQLLAPLRKALEDAGFEKWKRSDFIFSQGLEPGPEPYSGKWPSDVWRAECNKLEIATDAHMYGLKHTFNVDFVENNRGKIDWEWLRCHNRHATVQQTMDYIRELSPYFIDESTAVILDYHRPAAR